MTIIQIMACAGAFVGLALMCATWIAGAIRDAGDAVVRTIADEAARGRLQLGEWHRLEQLRTPSSLPPPPRVPAFDPQEIDAEMERASERRRVMTALGMQNTRPPRGS